MTLQEYKNKLANIEKAREKAYKEYIQSITNLRVGDKVRLIPLKNDKQFFANWAMEVKAIVPYLITEGIHTQKDGVSNIILEGNNTNGKKEIYIWISTCGDYELLKID